MQFFACCFLLTATRFYGVFYKSKTKAGTQAVVLGNLKSVLSSHPDKSDLNSWTVSSYTNGNVPLLPPRYKACFPAKVTIAPAILCKEGPGNLT